MTAVDRLGRARARMSQGIPLTTGDVAALYAVHVKTVARWAYTNNLPHSRTPGGHLRFDPAVIENLLTPEVHA